MNILLRSFAQDMAAEFEKGLWSDLQNDTNMAYKPPRLKGMIAYITSKTH